MLKSSSRAGADVVQRETSVARSGLFAAKEVER